MHAGVVRPQPRPEADRRLVCLSYCGGGTSPFRPWARILDDSCELALVCYPGRERRLAEPLAQDWASLLGDALAAVASLADRPYVLFGHSLGAWVAYEVAVHLERAGKPPMLLVASAANAPDQAAVERVRPPRADDGDEELLRWMREVGQLPALVLADPDLRQMALDLFRADKRAAESYEYVPGPGLAAPVQVLCGEQDPHLRGDGGWATVVAGPCRVDRLPGGHFYRPPVWLALPQWMDQVPTGSPV